MEVVADSKNTGFWRFSIKSLIQENTEGDWLCATQLLSEGAVCVSKGLPK